MVHSPCWVGCWPLSWYHCVPCASAWPSPAPRPGRVGTAHTLLLPAAGPFGVQGTFLPQQSRLPGQRRGAHVYSSPSRPGGLSAQGHGRTRPSLQGCVPPSMSPGACGFRWPCWRVVLSEGLCPCPCLLTSLLWVWEQLQEVTPLARGLTRRQRPS